MQEAGRTRSVRAWFGDFWWWVCHIPILRGPRRRCHDCGEKRDTSTQVVKDGTVYIVPVTIPRWDTCHNCGAQPSWFQR